MTANLLNFDAKGLTDFCIGIGEKPFRAKQLLRWIHQSSAIDFVSMSDLAKSLRDKLTDLAVIEAPQVISDHVASDGTRKWLLSVGTENAILVKLDVHWLVLSVRQVSKVSIVI